MIIVNINHHHLCHHLAHQYYSAVFERAEQHHRTWGSCPRRQGRYGTGEKITMIAIDILNVSLPGSRGEGVLLERSQGAQLQVYDNADSVDVDVLTWVSCPRREGRYGTGEKITMIMIEIKLQV